MYLEKFQATHLGLYLCIEVSGDSRSIFRLLSFWTMERSQECLYLRREQTNLASSVKIFQGQSHWPLLETISINGYERTAVNDPDF